MTAAIKRSREKGAEDTYERHDTFRRLSAGFRQDSISKMDGIYGMAIRIKNSLKEHKNYSEITEFNSIYWNKTDYH